MDIQAELKKIITDNEVVLFMKGTPEFPQCGFSSKSAAVLTACGAKYASVDVLSNPDIREGIKKYSNWPTIPQLYIRGEFIGGCDIISELHQTGELSTALKTTEAGA